MQWYVGIDEAGYGPNLGPFVMTCVTIQAEKGITNFWQHFPDYFHRVQDRKKTGILIDDSKKVHSSKNGLALLEQAVFCTMGIGSTTLQQFLQPCLVGTSWQDLQDEPWWEGTASIPKFQPVEDTPTRTLPAQCSFGPAWIAVVPTPRFNAILDQKQVKSAVSALCVQQLLQQLPNLEGDDDIQLTLDKQGGRDYYAPLLQETFPQQWITTVEEGRLKSSYQIPFEHHTLHVQVQPRADGEHLTVALASMLAKYLRELFMQQFNQYWQQFLPALTPTAGYPMDAKRYLQEIEPLIPKTGLTMHQIWRRK